MRVSVCNWRTSSGDIERTVSAFAKALGMSSADDSGGVGTWNREFMAEGI